MTKQEEIKKLQEKYNLTEAEAVQLWMEDNEEIQNSEIENLTAKAKANVRRYEQGDKARAKSTRERKVDENKNFLLDKIAAALASWVNITERKTETEIKFLYQNECYTLKLTKHRQKG